MAVRVRRNTFESVRGTPKSSISPSKQKKIDRAAKRLQRKINEASGADDSLGGAYINRAHVRPRRTIMIQEELVGTPIPGPTRIFPRSIIPAVVANPTIRAVSSRGEGAGLPWTTGPVSMAAQGAIPGAIQLFFQNKVVAAITAQLFSAGMERLGQIQDRRFKIRGITGKSGGQTGFGSALRPSGGGYVEDDPDPYEDPQDFIWFKPWTW